MHTHTFRITKNKLFFAKWLKSRIFLPLFREKRDFHLIFAPKGVPT